MARSKKDTNWVLIPGTAQDIAVVRERCRQLVRRRALWSAGVSAVPLPGLDVLTDLQLFSRLIDDINHEFGLTPAQIERLKPELRLIVYEAAVGVGGMLVGKLVTRELLVKLLQKTGFKSAARQAGKWVPLAGQAVSAGIGYALFRQIGYQHVEACAAVAQEVLVAQTVTPAPEEA